jgi:hypothetical protein
MPFRFAARHVFLTYAQAAAIPSKDELFLFLQSARTDRCVVSKEIHADGGVHYHALVRYRSKLDTTNERFWDLEGVHPNIVRPRKIEDCFNYVTKDGDFVNQGWNFDRVPIQEVVVAAAENPDFSHEQALRHIIATTGDQGLKMFGHIESYLTLLKKPARSFQNLRAFPDEFNTTQHWADEVWGFIGNLLVPPGGREDGVYSLWFYGPSRLGKTQLARSLGRHWYMQGMWNVESYCDDAEYGVLDDITWDSLKVSYKALLGWQRDITVTDKYRKKCNYTHGKGVIVLSNELPAFSLEEYEWLRKNVHFVQFTEKVW